MPILTVGEREIPYQLKTSRRRRSLALQVNGEQAVTVYAPAKLGWPTIDRFVQARGGWLVKKLDQFAEIARQYPPRRITAEELARHKAEAAALMAEAVARLAPGLNVFPKKISIGNQKRRWGSCTSAGHLRFNWRLALMPAEIRDYVVVHELAHLRVANHSARFWATVATVLPDHKSRRRWLRVNSLQFSIG